MTEMMEREKIYLEESIDNAVINAYKKANKELKIKKTNNNIIYITSDAKTNLKVGDNIISINDTKINSISDLQDYVSKLGEKEKVTLKVLRGGKEKEAYATVYKTSDGLKLGISFINTYEYETKPKVKISSKSSEMGSSGGLMMSLTIYNGLVKEDITHGKKIVGTGTIDIDGNVGEIGGVKYKLIGAVKKGAEVFICPEENYEEANKIKKEKNYKIKIISAKTFDEVLSKLKDI